MSDLGVRGIVQIDWEMVSKLSDWIWDTVKQFMDDFTKIIFYATTATVSDLLKEDPEFKRKFEQKFKEHLERAFKMYGYPKRE